MSLLSPRPGSTRTRGVALLLLCSAPVGTLAACAKSEVQVLSPTLSRPDGTACAQLLEALPERLAGLDRRETSPPGAPARAWGDPAVVVECGTPASEEFDGLSTCQEVDGVEWFVPEEQIADQSADVVMSTIGFAPTVTVRVPAERRPPMDVFVELAPAIRTSLRHVSSCDDSTP